MATVGNFLNPCVTKLELLCNGKEIGSATGFFYRNGSQWFVITNWHVLSGRDPATGQPRHAQGAVPDACRFYSASLKDRGIAWSAITYELGDACLGTAKWLQHPTEGQQVDIAALAIDAADKGLSKDLQDPGGSDPEMFIDLGGELFLPGYPLGLSAAGYMSLWKRASLASSLEFGQGINRMFYVDTATREGMSGAPCLAISNWRHYAMDRSTGKVRVVEKPLSWRLLGVYSGRKNASDSFEAQIGLVWRENLMQEVLSGGKQASVHLV